MQQYEIRITKKGATHPRVIRAALMSAYAAIRRALKFSEEGDQVEVWLGLSCLYSSAGQAI
jgi:hypothetical protein